MRDDVRPRYDAAARRTIYEGRCVGCGKDYEMPERWPWQECPPCREPSSKRAAEVCAHVAAVARGDLNAWEGATTAERERILLARRSMNTTGA